MRASQFVPSDWDKTHCTEDDDGEELPVPAFKPQPVTAGGVTEAVTPPAWMANLEKARAVRNRKPKASPKDAAAEAEAHAERIHFAAKRRLEAQAAERRNRLRQSRESPLREALRHLHTAQDRQAEVLDVLNDRVELTTQARKCLEERGIALWQAQRAVLAAFNAAETQGATVVELKGIIAHSIGNPSRPPCCDRCGYPHVINGPVGQWKCARCNFTMSK